jgi:signal transduction histidine kinase
MAGRIEAQATSLQRGHNDLAMQQSEVQEKNRQLDLALQEAQSAVKAKSEFLAVMSHEIRTPMNGVIGMTSILADTELTEIQRDCVNTIHTSGESLLTVINDILDFSKIESGRINLESRSFNLRQCVEEALDLFAAEIRIKRLEAVYLIAPGIPPNLIGDVMRLRKILVNMIGNAIKFTSQGEIVINVECQNRDEKGYHFVFSVTDTGIGISKKGIEKLFQAFQQGDTSTTRRYGGTGLGLVISKRLTEFMGGTMWVESELGRGSTFFFTAFMKASSEAASEDQSPAPALLGPHFVLIVDDNAHESTHLGGSAENLGNDPDFCALRS